MTAFGIRLLLRWRELQRSTASTSSSTTSASPGACSRSRRSGTPVAAVIHHPLHIDREADFAIDPRFRKQVEAHALLPAVDAADRRAAAGAILTVSKPRAREIERYFGIPEKDVSVVYNGTDAELFRPLGARRRPT